MPWLLDIAYVLAAVLYAPILLYQMLAKGKNRRGWRHRFGGIPSREGRRPGVWIHAVSLGEVNATRALAAKVAELRPDCDVLISATTDTGYAAACRLYDPARVFRYPLDFSFVVRRVLDRIRPAVIILMELEVWPNLISLAHSRGIPVCIANGRVTEEKSMRRFRRPIVRGLARRMFGRITWIGAQDETYAARFRELGAPPERVHISGSMKYDTASVADSIPGDAELAAAMGIDRTRPLIVAGSTGPEEEALLLGAYASLRVARPGLQLAIIPRKPERFDEVARLVEARGYACVRRSVRPDGAAPPAPGTHAFPSVLLGDTMGELRKFYALASVVFVGRSLVPLGGSDVMEVAGLGRAMCFGPHMENFAEAVEKLRSAKAALQVASVEELIRVVSRLLDDAAEAKAMGRRAQDVVRQNVGATRRTAEAICALLPR